MNYPNQVYAVKALTEQQKEKVLSLFFRTELREGEEVIDNRDSTIAKETGIRQGVIRDFLACHLEDKFQKLNK